MNKHPVGDVISREAQQVEGIRKDLDRHARPWYDTDIKFLLSLIPPVPATTVDARAAAEEAAQTIVDIAKRDNMQVPHRDTMVEIILSRQLAAAPAGAVELVSAEYEKGFEDGAAFTLATLKENMGHLDTRTAGADYFHCHLCGIVKPHDGWKKQCPQVLPEITMRAAAPVVGEGEAMKAKCIERIRFIAGEWYTDAIGNGRAFSDKANTANFIADELESITLAAEKEGSNAK